MTSCAVGQNWENGEGGRGKPSRKGKGERGNKSGELQHPLKGRIEERKGWVRNYGNIQRVRRRKKWGRVSGKKKY